MHELIGWRLLDLFGKPMGDPTHGLWSYLMTPGRENLNSQSPSSSPASPDVHIHPWWPACLPAETKASWASLLAGELQIREEEKIALVDRQGVEEFRRFWIEVSRVILGSWFSCSEFAYRSLCLCWSSCHMQSCLLRWNDLFLGRAYSTVFQSIISRFCYG